MKPAQVELSLKEWVVQILKQLNEVGYLLEADAGKNSIALMMHGKPWKGSWWSLPNSNLIYNVCLSLQEHKDIICVKWVDSKRTYIHRSYWYTFIDEVLMDKKKKVALSPAARKLLEKVETEKKLTFEVPKDLVKYNKLKSQILELEKKLICYVASEHSDSGAHIKKLMTWEELFRIKKFKYWCS